MSGSQPTNNSAVDFEKEQAAEADQKEAERQARLTQGQTLIDQIFNGSPVMGTKTNTFDWSTFNPQAYQQAASAAQYAANSNLATAPPGSGGVPAGYTAVQVAAPKTTTATTTATPPIRLATTPTGLPQTAATQTPWLQGGGGGMSWAIKGPDGKIYNQGDPLSYDTTYDTGQTSGGFDDAFYDAYKQKVLDYYQPDEQRQYDAAQRDLKYSLARAGTLQSSTAADKQGELAYNDALQKANIVANANAQEGQLKSQIQSNKQALINQLYTTEDPTLTANLAQSSAQASRLQDPTLTPAAALFTPALTTVGSAVQGLLYPSGAGASTFANPNQSPTPASASGNPGSGVLTR